MSIFAVGLLPPRTGFDPRSVHVSFVVGEVAVGQVFLRLLPLSPVSTIPPMLRTVFLRPLPLSPVSTIPPMLHSHLRLHFAFKNTRRTSGRSLGTFQKAMLFRKYRSTGQTITFIFFVLRGLPAQSLQRCCCLEL